MTVALLIIKHDTNLLISLLSKNFIKSEKHFHVLLMHFFNTSINKQLKLMSDLLRITMRYSELLVMNMHIT